MPKSSEDACKHFYDSVLGLEEIPKPAQLLKNGGAWYKVGNEELHVSIEDDGSPNLRSMRHVCYIVRDLSAAKRELQSQGIEIITDRQAMASLLRP